MRALLIALACASLMACGSKKDPGDASEDTPVDMAESDAVDTNGWPERDSTDPPGDEVDAPLGMCGVYCMGENRPCPDGALCEYGVIDPSFICTDDGCGLCAWIPDECEPEDDPACGCDGVVYENPCERRRAEAQPDPSWMSCAVPEPDEIPESAPEPSEEPDI